MLAGLIVGTANLPAQESKPTQPAKRYGLDADLRAYPQNTPQKALESVLSAIQRERFDYLLAQLVDPPFVDERVRRLNGKFEEVVKETITNLTSNPQAVQELYRFLKEGEWEVGDLAASAQLKDVKDRRVFLRKRDDRWYLENRQKPDGPAQ